MKFSEKLNEYISLLSCTSKDLYTLADISAASFTRYRKGERVPELRTPPFDSLCAAIAELAAQKGLPDVTAETVKESFTSCEDFVTTDKERLRQNFNTLLTTLNINLTRLCQYTNYDASTISASGTVPESRAIPSSLPPRLPRSRREKCGHRRNCLLSLSCSAVRWKNL